MNPDPTPSTPAPAASKFGVNLADVLVAGGALIILLFSWGRVVSYTGYSSTCPSLSITCRDSVAGKSLWSYVAPLGIFVILATLGLLATAAVDTWWKRDKQMVGLHRHVVQVGLALFVLVTIFGLMLSGGVGVSVGWGGIVQFLGALIAAAGAILNHFNLLQNRLELPAGGPKPTFPPSGTYGQPQQPGQYQQPAQYQQQPGGYPQQQPGTYGQQPPQGGYTPPAQGPGVDPNMPPTTADPTAQFPPQQ